MRRYGAGRVDEARKLLQVTEILDAERFRGAWRGQHYECRALPGTGGMAVGDEVICHVLPDNTQLIYIAGCDSLPYGVIVIFSGTVAQVPANWAYCDRAYGTGTPRLIGRFIVGAAGAYDIADQGGSNAHNLNHGHGVTNANSSLATSTHNHTYGPRTTSGPSPLNVILVGDGGGLAQSHTHAVGPDTVGGGSHTHLWNVPSNTVSFTGSFDNRPRYRALVYMMHLGGDSDFPIGSIHGWSGALGSLPSGYALCDGTGGTVDLSDYFVICEGGTYAHNTTGGSNNKDMSHQHAAPNSSGWRSANESPLHSHTGGGTSSITDPAPTQGGGPAGYERPPDAHSHVYTIDGESGASGHWHQPTGNVAVGSGATENRPRYYTLAFIQRMS